MPESSGASSIKTTEKKEDGRIDFLKTQYSILKTELSELKQCQMNYIIISISATAILLGGFGHILLTVVTVDSLVSYSSYNDMKSLIYFPLLFVLLPTWMIFFDKASTISRGVGYLRILEIAIIHKKNIKKFWGFENDMRKHREFQKNHIFSITDIFDFQHFFEFLKKR